MLAQHFLKESARKLGTKAPPFSAAQLKELQAYDWPGNVRELQNVIERAAIRSRNGHLDLGLRPSGRVNPRGARAAESGAVSDAPASFNDLKDQERAIIVGALNKTNGRIYGSNGAAALLGLKPTTLSSKVRRLGLKKISFS